MENTTNEQQAQDQNLDQADGQAQEPQQENAAPAQEESTEEVAASEVEG